MKRELEALLFATDSPLTAGRLKKIFPEVSTGDLKQVLTELNLYATYLFKQIEIYQFSKNYNHKLLFHFTNNGINNLVRKYHRNIVRIEVEEEKADMSIAEKYSFRK